LKTVKKLEKGVVRSFHEHSVLSLCAALSIEATEVSGDDPRTITSRLEPRPVSTDAQTSRSDMVIQLYFAVPMASVGAGYEDLREEMLGVLKVLRTELGFVTVFCAAEDRPRVEDFEDEAIALRGNLSLLRRSRCVVAVYPLPIVSSVLVEIGIALALDIPVLVLVKQREDLPFMLRVPCTEAPVLRVIRYVSAQDARSIILGEVAFLREAVRRGDRVV
jgi:hypothetical protein